MASHVWASWLLGSRAFYHLECDTEGNRQCVRAYCVPYRNHFETEACLPRITMSLAFPSSTDAASGFALFRRRSLFSSPSLNPRFHSPCHLHLSFLGCTSQPHTFSCRRYAANPGQPPPESEPPFDNDLMSAEGLDATLSRFQDRVQIFFAVLFWMSLFFWACAWGDRNDGRPSKGSRFRR